ncbi:MAG: glycoside hydrolase family 3 C-terminal domain-containing protein, partial [Lachnospiraceae bacterium]|nr:glycoside hydrolase family 3 C-terminal domain-containing protein [Lachnospiraceae bacterium]
GNSDEFKFDRDEHHEIAKNIAAETFVLLKNEGNVLPLNKNTKIAVVGAYAKTPRFQGGGSAHINCHKITSFLDACSENGLADIKFAEGFSPVADDFDENLCNEAVAIAKEADVTLIFAGLPDIFESEGYDRKHMNMPSCQLKVIDEVSKVAKKTVIVLHNGSPIEMPFVNNVDAILECYLGGQAVGGAQFDVIFGDKSPSGRLAETFPIRLEDNPSYINFPGYKDNVNYAEDIFVGYRYYDKKKMDVLFPFGFGLSYTEFKYENLKLSSNNEGATTSSDNILSIDENDGLTVTVDVTNIDSVKAKEVVQLYVKNCETKVLRPIREFKGFEKIELVPGETKTVTFNLNKRSFAYFDERIHDWAVPTGTYEIEIGKSSRDIQLSAPVNVIGKPVLPDKYDYNSVTEDLIEDPRITNYVKNYLTGAKDDHERSEVEKESMNEEMEYAGVMFSPLRSGLYFSAGKIRYDDIDEFLEEINKVIKE